MSDTAERALLPAGLQDLLPPEAAQEAAILDRLVGAFAASGYQRVKPPFMEFEETLLSGAGRAVAQESFRLMDPVSQRMMALRADMTPQVARIAATRLGAEPRPLRLCYGGQVLRVRGGQLRPERQFAQAGAELIGAAEAAGDAEVVVLAAEALAAVGVAELTVDLNLPPLVPLLAEDLGLPGEAAEALRLALDRKDAAAVGAAAGGEAPLFHALLQAGGPAEAALAALAALSLPPRAGREVARLAEVVALIQAAAPALRLMVDPAEHRGFEYQTGISFTLFAQGLRGELGRGGRYSADGFGGPPETSTGFTLYMDTVLRALPAAETPRRVFVPAGSPAAEARALREAGWITIAGLSAVDDVAGEARRLACSHVLRDGRAESI